MQEFGYFGGCGVATDKDSCCLGSGNVDIKRTLLFSCYMLLRNEIIMYTLLDVNTEIAY
jgi:hypothetical protein